MHFEHSSTRPDQQRKPVNLKIADFIEYRINILIKDRFPLSTIIKDIKKGDYDFQSRVTSAELQKTFIDKNADNISERRTKEWHRFVPEILNRLKPEKNALVSIFTEKSWVFFKKNNQESQIISEIQNKIDNHKDSIFNLRHYFALSELENSSSNKFIEAIKACLQEEEIASPGSPALGRLKEIAQFNTINEISWGFEGNLYEIITPGVRTASAVIRTLIQAIPTVCEKQGIELTPELYEQICKNSYSSIIKRVSMLHSHVAVPIFDDIDHVNSNISTLSTYNPSKYFKIVEVKNSNGYKLKLQEDFLVEMLQKSKKDSLLAKVYLAYLKIFDPKNIPQWIHQRFSNLFQKLPSVTTWCPANFSIAKDEQKNVIEAYFDWTIEVAKQGGIFNLIKDSSRIPD